MGIWIRTTNKCGIQIVGLNVVISSKKVAKKKPEFAWGWPQILMNLLMALLLLIIILFNFCLPFLLLLLVNNHNLKGLMAKIGPTLRAAACNSMSGWFPAGIADIAGGAFNVSLSLNFFRNSIDPIRIVTDTTTATTIIATTQDWCSISSLHYPLSKTWLDPTER